MDFQLFGIYNDLYPAVTGKKKQEEAYNLIIAADKLITPLVEKKIGYSDFYRLKGEINIRMLSFVGFAGGGMAAVELSNSAKKLLETALSLDNKNAGAYATLGSWYLFAPSIAGGSAQAALSLLNKAREYGSKYEIFMSYIWSTWTYYNNLQQSSKALDEIKKALEIAPDHGWALEIEKTIKSGGGLSSW
ncbi:MAG: hypothetical protein JW795_12670 [Chitinivibrionales bacterium]|nr:hypothetical protein [Chitinivibrionales bacterium]